MPSWDGSAVEGVDLERVARESGRPASSTSRAAIENAWLGYDRALAGIAHEVCYSVKANSNLAVIDVLGRLGSGFDIVSGGELARVLAAGVPGSRIVFSGVGKRDDEMAQALRAGVGCFTWSRLGSSRGWRRSRRAPGFGRRCRCASIRTSTR